MFSRMYKFVNILLEDDFEIEDDYIENVIRDYYEKKNEDEEENDDGNTNDFDYVDHIEELNETKADDQKNKPMATVQSHLDEELNVIKYDSTTLYGVKLGSRAIKRKRKPPKKREGDSQTMEGFLDEAQIPDEEIRSSIKYNTLYISELCIDIITLLLCNYSNMTDEEKQNNIMAISSKAQSIRYIDFSEGDVYSHFFNERNPMLSRSWYETIYPVGNYLSIILKRTGYTIKF